MPEETGEVVPAVLELTDAPRDVPAKVDEPVVTPAVLEETEAEATESSAEVLVEEAGTRMAKSSTDFPAEEPVAVDDAIEEYLSSNCLYYIVCSFI